nr:extensin-like [Aegilops tauschii subsp. strangulata]
MGLKDDLDWVAPPPKKYKKVKRLLVASPHRVVYPPPRQASWCLCFLPAPPRHYRKTPTPPAARRPRHLDLFPVVDPANPSPSSSPPDHIEPCRHLCSRTPVRVVPFSSPPPVSLVHALTATATSSARVVPRAHVTRSYAHRAPANPAAASGRLRRPVRFRPWPPCGSRSGCRRSPSHLRPLVALRRTLAAPWVCLRAPTPERLRPAPPD